MRYLFILFILTLFCPLMGFAQLHIHNVPEAIVTVESTADGAIIALSANGKLYHYNGVEYTLLQEGMQGATQLMVLDQVYLVISSSGIWKWSDGEMQHQLLSESCYSYIKIEDEEYVLTPTGIFIFSEGRYQLVNDWTIPIDDNAKFHEFDNQYYLTNANTIYQYKSGTWRALVRDTIVFNDLALYKDKLYAATSSGLRVINERKAEVVMIDGLDGFLNVNLLFNLDDNLFIQGGGALYKWSLGDYMAHRIDGKSSPSKVILDAWNDIWYAEQGNIMQHKIGDKEIQPIISKIEISVNGVVQNDDDIIVQEEGSDIKIYYQAHHLRNPQNIKYQSRLSPIDDTFRELTTDRSVVYSDVPAGDFKYRLRATIDGLNYTYNDTIEFKVKAENKLSSWWWVLGGISIGMLILALLANYRLQQYKERSTLLTAKLRTANELLAAQQKTMQLQMNPHFLFNALNSIQGLVALKRNDEAKIYLRRFSRMMRSILDFSTVDKIDLKTEMDHLNDYLSIEQMTRSNSFNYTIDVDESLLDEDIQLPPMILQPFIENAIIHGVSSIQNGEITIRIKDMNTILHCTITDNGIGRKAAMNKKKSNHKSVAISLAQNRLSQISKSENQGSILYTDLPQGTQVEILIPIV